jgi:hypothetical protein
MHGRGRRRAAGGDGIAGTAEALSAPAREREDGQREPEALLDAFEQAALLPAGAVVAPDRDEQVIGRELAHRIVEGEQRIVGTDAALCRGAEFVELAQHGAEARVGPFGCAVGVGSEPVEPGSEGATTMISSAASMSVRTPNGNSSMLPAASPAAMSSLRLM